MSTTGVNISSLLSSLGSSSSGIDVTTAVAQAISADSGPLTQMQNQQAVFTSDTSDINLIETDIGTLQTSLSALNDPVGAMNAMTTASSNTSMVTATAEAGTVAGTHVVTVNNLASTASWYSGEVATSSTALATGSFSLQVGSSAPVQVNIGGAVDTLDQLASSINGLNAGVTASVVNDSGGSRLAIVSNNSGAANDFTISGATGLNFTRAVTGQDASLTVDGIPVDSASNTVSGVITGVTFNLLSAPAGGTANITIAPDASQASSAVSSFVTAYNKVIADVNQEYALGSNGVEGPLSGDPVVSVLQSQMLSAGSYTSGGTGGISTLGDLGITMNNDGTLSLDTSTLTNAVQNNYSGVQSFFQGAALNGFASMLGTQLTSMTDPTDGAFTVDLQSISNENSDLQTQITNFQAYLATQTTLLTNEYNQADIALQELPIEEQQINAELGNPTTTSSN